MQYSCFDQSIIYVIEDELFNKETEHKTQAQKDIYISNPNMEAAFYLRARRFNKEKLKVVLQISGVKDHFVFLMVEKVFQSFIDLGLASAPSLKRTYKRSNSELNKQNELKAIMTNRSFFNSILQKNLKEHSPMIEKKILSNFDLSCDLVEQNRTVIILLGGTSGTGKSSVSSLLGSRLGIATVLSTDSTRHILRNFLDKEDCPLLFASTYECGSLLIGEEYEKLNEKEKVVKGYQQQCKLVQERLEKVIDSYQRKGESFVIEGVHLTPDFMVRMSKKYKNCLPFTLYISNENKHKERFAVRSKYMTLDEGHNKYVANFQNIRRIQKYFIKKTEKLLIPKIDNTNIDKSMGLIHKTIISYIKSHIDYFKKPLETVNEGGLDNLSATISGEANIEKSQSRADVWQLYEVFNKVTKNVWSTKAVKEYITSKANKTDIYERFFKDHEQNPPINYEGEVEDGQKHADEVGTDLNDFKNTSLATSSQNNNATAEGTDINMLMRSQSVKSSPGATVFKEDEGEFIDMRQPIPERTSSVVDKNTSETNKNQVVFPETESKGGEDNSDKKQSAEKGAVPNIGEDESEKNQKPLATVVVSTPSPMNNNHKSKMKIKLNEMRELISKQDKLNINIKISKQHLKKIVKLLSDINEGGNTKETLKLYRTNKRYIIYKFSENEIKINPEPAQLKAIIKENTKTNAKKIIEENKEQSEPIKETLEENNSEGSMEEVSEMGEEDIDNDQNSSVSGSMEMNFHGISFRGNYSEKHEISDNDSWKIDEEDHLVDNISENDNQSGSEMDSVATESEGSGDSEHDSKPYHESKKNSKHEKFIRKSVTKN